MELLSGRVPISLPLPLTLYSQKGFSLLALIGVLAVITISLSVVAPALIKNMEREHQETEALQLRHIADGIQHYI